MLAVSHGGHFLTNLAPFSFSLRLILAIQGKPLSAESLDYVNSVVFCMFLFRLGAWQPFLSCASGAFGRGVHTGEEAGYGREVKETGEGRRLWCAAGRLSLIQSCHAFNRVGCLDAHPLICKEPEKSICISLQLAVGTVFTG